MKVPVVKAKIGTKIMTMIADEKVFLQLPLKTEVKVVISGLYITEIKSVPRGGLIPLPKKKTIGQRIKGIFKKTESTRKRQNKKAPLLMNLVSFRRQGFFI